MTEILYKLSQNHFRNLNHHATAELGKLTVNNHGGRPVEHAVRGVCRIGNDRRRQVHRCRGPTFVCTFTTQHHRSVFGVRVDYIDGSAKLRHCRPHFNLDGSFVAGIA